ncbi:MAG: dTDP-4-dehydrorhamnose reductase [Moraxella sp.]|nr:dTDP-4-dehydrorhamnose reductase [Moraxella sp.]
MTKILLLGKNGQVGFELHRALQPLGQVLALNRNTNQDGHCGDVADFNAISSVIDDYQPDVIVNATAYTAVDNAETDTDNADLINHLAVKHLAFCAKKINALLIHYSTDYVFDGQGDEAWIENDTTNPINHYGYSKRQGEIALENSGCSFINIRTSWVYGVYGHNFLKTMLKLGKERDTLNIINDQIGSPTPAFLIADITAHILQTYQHSSNFDKNGFIGHYHLAPSGYCSWYDYAQFIFNTARKLNIELKVNMVNPIPTSDYPTPAKRPLNSRLNCDKLKTQFNISLPHWQFGVEQVLKTLTQSENQS